jgi:hypothetical protein
MSRRFYHQMRAAQYQDEKAKIDEYYAKTLKQKQDLFATQKAITKNPRSAVSTQVAFIIPFGVKPADNFMLEVGLVTDGQTVVGKETAATLVGKLRQVATTSAVPFITVASDTFPPAGTISQTAQGKKFKLAKVKLVEAEDAAAVRISSRVTGTTYSYKKKNSVSTTFGQGMSGAAHETYEACKAAMKAKWASMNTPNAKIYFSPQGDINVNKKA